MGDPTKLKLAPAIVTYDGVDLGYTSFGDPIVIEDESKEVELKAAQEGDTPVDSVLTGHRCSVTVPLVEVTPDKLVLAIPNSSIAGTTVTIKNRVGQSQRALAKELRVIRVVSGVPSVDPADNFIFPLASPMAGTVSQEFDAQSQQKLSFKFHVWQDPTTKEFYHVG